MANRKKSDELIIANIELAFQSEEKEKRAAELVIVTKELYILNEEKEKRAAELILANKELAFQNNEKENRAAELVIAKIELAFQNNEKESRAAELVIANKELDFQNDEKGNRAAELVIANKELAFQNNEKESRAAELVIANKELVFQNEEKGNRAAELVIANKELVFQNEEKENRAAELVIANKELLFQNEEKGNRAAELVIANKELVFQNEEKEKRAAELIIANKELAFQNEEKEKRAEELIIANEKLNKSAELLQKNLKEIFYYKYALDESSIIAFTDENGIIKKVNNNFCKITKYSEEELIGQDHRIINSGYHTKEFIHDLWVTISKGKIWKGQFKNKAKDGNFYWVDTTIVPFLDEQGKPYQYLAIRADITDRKEAEEYLIQRTAQLETANKELVFQNEEKEKRAAELIIANIELAFQNKEKENRAADLIILTEVLKVQKEELRLANEELYEKAQLLLRQEEKLIRINEDLLYLNQDLENRVFQRTCELENLNHELKDLNLSKDKFLSIISHDLRNPLTALLISSDKLRLDTENPVFNGIQPLVKIIHSTSNKILQQLNELLEWAKLQKDKTSINPGKLHLVRAVDQSLELLKANALQKNIVLENEVSFDLYVNADTLMFRSILQNLVTNAIKYTPHGGMIKITAQRIDKMVEVCVTDSGIGMEEHTRENLFTNSAPIQLSGTNNEKGSGLGLILVKDFVTQHGGTIRVESEREKGTCIIFTVPEY